MKQFILVAFMLLALTTTKAIAQAVTPTQNGLPSTRNQPWVFNSYVNFTGWQYENAPLIVGSEYTTARNYTILGLYPIVIDSAAGTNDTLKLLKANVQPGQIIRILVNGAANDTMSILHDGSFNGATASPYLLSPATAASIKKAIIYVDKLGNYWTL